MTVYLPIAELSVNIFTIIAFGLATGMLSGMFGVGGGFIMTPLLMFNNIPPAVAVASGANQAVASSISGAIGHFRLGNLDIKLGCVLLVGGITGASLGVWLFALLRQIGQLELVIALLYVLLLGSIGISMLRESLGAIRRSHCGLAAMPRHGGQHGWMHGLPLRMRFRKSGLYLSAIPIGGIGFGIGVLTSIMGVGGGFILVPAMIYLLRVPTHVVVGTSLFQIVFVSAYATVAQAITNHSVDIVLATVLMFAGVIGAQLGVMAGRRLRGEQLRALLALLVLAVAFWLGADLTLAPADPYFLAKG